MVRDADINTSPPNIQKEGEGGKVLERLGVGNMSGQSMEVKELVGRLVRDHGNAVLEERMVGEIGRDREGGEGVVD